MGLTAQSVGRGASDTELRQIRREPNDHVIALVGNPNVGKSTVFNALTGMKQHTGNWPGKTVTLAQGRFCYKGSGYIAADLPGTYSLLSRSEEERVTAQYLLSKRAECIVAVCDATCLERNLNLVLQLMTLGMPMLVCVNLMDEAQKKQIMVDTRKLERLLGVPVIAAAAGRGEGISSLQERIRGVIEGYEALPPKTEDTQKLIAAINSGKRTDEAASETVRRAQQIAKQVISERNGAAKQKERRIDRILTGRLTGIPILMLLLILVLWLTVKGANYPSELLTRAFDAVAAFLHRAGNALRLPPIVCSAVIDGVFQTTARVVAVMLPPIAIFFPLFTLLEDVGYLPRLAFLTDHAFSKCGACGKQSLTTCMGFGCNAAGVVGCRIIDSPRERLIAILTNSFIPCNGRFPALIALSCLLIGSSSFAATLTVTGFVLLGVAMSMLLSLLLSKTLLRGEQTAFTLELPPFRVPKIGQVIVRSVLDRTLFVLGRAAAVAAPAGLLLWCLANVTAADVSLLAHAQAALEPTGLLLGMNGAMLLAFILGFPANELVLPTVLMILTGGGSLASGGSLGAVLAASGWTAKQTLCTMVFFLFHWPCSTTLLTVARETKSAKWTLLSLLLPTVTGAALCALLNLIL